MKVGIIGTGLIAREHAQAVAMTRGAVTLIAAADIVSNRLQDFCTSFQIPRSYEAAADLIADPDVDLVAITTPPAVHESLAVAALEKGKYVLCEKPLAHSLASAARIAEAEARHAGRLAVSYQMRYDSSFRRLIWLCNNGWIGKVQSALIERHSYIPQSDPGKNSWWGSWEVAGGGVLITQLIHELDLLFLVMGRPLSVSAKMDTRYTDIESEDYMEATFRFSDGGSASCIASVNSGRLTGRIAIQGSRGEIGLPWDFRIEDQNGLSKAVKAVNTALPDTRPPSSSIVSRGSRFLARRLGLKKKPELIPHARLYQKIAQNIENGEPLPVPPLEALNSLEMCMAAYESAITGKEIALPLSSISTVYGGVSKEGYDARKCLRKTTELAINTTSRNSAVRIGLVGLDTSHAPTFTKILHDPNDPFHIPGARVVAAYRGGSPDMEISISRVEGFTSELRDIYGVPIVDTPEKVAEACDLLFILSSDGRLHPALFKAVAGRGKPVFIDKPFAISFASVQHIYKIAAETNTRVFGSSAFRYADGLVDSLTSIRAGGERVKTCHVLCWLPIEETQGRYFWYGIHGAEMLLTSMGRGVREVEATGTADEDCITVWHEDGRKSSITGSRGDGRFQISLETEKRQLAIDLGLSMPSLSARLLWAALDVLSDGKFPRLWRATSAGSVLGNRPGRVQDPVSAETVEVVRLLDAAQRSYASQQKVII